MLSATVRLVLFAAACLGSGPTMACMCVALAFESLVDQAETIMVVRIVRTESRANAGEDAPVGPTGAAPPAIGKSGLGVRAEFELLRSLKQSSPMPEYLQTGYGGDDCGIELLAGSNYLVLTNADGVVTQCSGTRMVGVADAIDCRTQAWIAAVEQRVADRVSEIVPLGDAPPEIDQKVIDALKAGRSAFDAGCDLAQPGGGNAK